MAPREAAYDRPGGYLPRPHPYSLQSVRRTHATPPSRPWPAKARGRENGRENLDFPKDYITFASVTARPPRPSPAPTPPNPYDNHNNIKNTICKRQDRTASRGSFRKS